MYEKHIKEQNKQLEIICRAYDTSFNRQPEGCKNDLLYNSRGYLANNYHRIKVFVD